MMCKKNKSEIPCGPLSFFDPLFGRCTAFYGHFHVRGVHPHIIISNYIHTVSELFRVGDSTICNIVSKLLIELMYEVAVHFPTTERDNINLIIDAEKLCYRFGAIDACQIPIECPTGGQESAKEYRNSKNLYSIVVMAIADNKYYFIWANCSIPGNSDESAVFQVSELYRQITENNLIPNIGNIEDEQGFTPLLAGGLAFPFRTWLLKPFENAILRKDISITVFLQKGWSPRGLMVK